MVESTHESKVDVNSRSGNQNRNPSERLRIPKKLGDAIREKEGLGPTDPIHQLVKERLEKWIDGTELLLNPDDRTNWIRYLQSIKMKDEVATPTALERVKKLNLLNPAAYDAARNAVEGNDFEFLDDNCDQLGFNKPNWVCIQSGTPPEVKTIGKDVLYVKQYCKICIAEKERSNRIIEQLQRREAASADYTARTGLAYVQGRWVQLRPTRVAKRM